MPIVYLAIVDVKKTLELFANQINPKLADFWDQELDKNFGFNSNQKNLVKKLLLHAKDHNSKSGKRLRSALVYYTNQIGKQPDSQALWNVCMAVELIHTALLMHDDFMDQDTLRRGQPTTHQLFAAGDPHYGQSMAVNLGDTVLLLGYELLLNSGFSLDLSSQITSIYLRGIIQTAWGQAFDLSIPKQATWTESDVVALHTTKTAIYTYETPILIGATLANLPQDIMPIFQDYAYHAGVAFQIQDDILGIFGDSEKTGKSSNSDLLQGKSTLLALKTLQLGSKQQQANLQAAWGNQDASSDLIQAAKQAIIDSGSLKYNQDFSKQEASLACQSLEKLDPKRFFGPGVEFLQNIANYMRDREL